MQPLRQMELLERWRTMTETVQRDVSFISTTRKHPCSGHWSPSCRRLPIMTSLYNVRMGLTLESRDPRATTALRSIQTGMLTRPVRNYCLRRWSRCAAPIIKFVSWKWYPVLYRWEMDPLSRTCVPPSSDPTMCACLFPCHHTKLAVHNTDLDCTSCSFVKMSTTLVALSRSYRRHRLKRYVPYWIL